MKTKNRAEIAGKYLSAASLATTRRMNGRKDSLFLFMARHDMAQGMKFMVDHHLIDLNQKDFCTKRILSERALHDATISTKKRSVAYLLGIGATMHLGALVALQTGNSDIFTAFLNAEQIDMHEGGDHAFAHAVRYGYHVEAMQMLVVEKDQTKWSADKLAKVERMLAHYDRINTKADGTLKRKAGPSEVRAREGLVSSARSLSFILGPRQVGLGRPSDTCTNG